MITDHVAHAGQAIARKKISRINLANDMLNIEEIDFIRK
jgi:hypothetical protein